MDLVTFKDDLIQNIKIYPIIFIISLFYVGITVLHSLYLYNVVENGNLLFLGIISLYFMISVLEFLFIINLNDYVVFGERNSFFDFKNIMYYVKKCLVFIGLNLFFLSIGIYLIGFLNDIFLGSAILNKASYLLLIPKFILFYIVIYNIKHSLQDDSSFFGFLEEIRENYILSIIGVLFLFLTISALSFLMGISNSSILYRLLVSFPISLIVYLYQTFIISIK